MSLVAAIVTVVTSAAFAGILSSLLFARQTKRKIDSEAQRTQASATDILTGAALEMVRTAQADARSARDEAASARQRAEAAEELAIKAEQAAVACATEAANLTRSLDRYRQYVTSRGLDLLD